MSDGPLTGLRVLDLTRILAGPTCTQLLGDMGADVIKIERPGRGDDTRSWGPPFARTPDDEDTAESAYYLSSNRNKRSVALDLKSRADTIRELAAHCDILVENFKVGGLARFGLDFETLHALYPRLVYCSITGFGQTGPHAHRPGYDLLAQGYGGIMSLTGEPEGRPMKVGVGVADVMCGMYASTAILAALHHRERTGEGQHIDVALVDVQIAWLVNSGVHYLTSGEAPARRGNEHPNIVPYGVYAVSDGHVIVAVGNDAQFERFCGLIDRPELATMERFASNAARLVNRDELSELLEARLRSLNSAALLGAMEREGVPGGPIHTLPEVFASDQAEARGMQIQMPHPQAGEVRLIGNPLKFSATPVRYRRPPPTCGEHTDEVIEELLGPDR